MTIRVFWRDRELETMTARVFWREKGTKRWHEGWITKQEGDMIRIGKYIDDTISGVWYDKKDLDIKERT